MSRRKVRGKSVHIPSMQVLDPTVSLRVSGSISCPFLWMLSESCNLVLRLALFLCPPRLHPSHLPIDQGGGLTPGSLVPQSPHLGAVPRFLM